MRGVILERFGWTMDYLLHGIPFLDVHYMMIDAPRYVPPPQKPPTPEVHKSVPGLGNPEPKEEVEKVPSKGDRLNSFLNKLQQ